MPALPHFGRSKKYKTVRVAAWRNRNFDWHYVEDVNEQKVGRYPSRISVERASIIIVAGNYEYKVDEDWVRAHDLKYLPSHTPFTKNHTIDDFCKAAEDRYTWRFI